VLIQAVPGFVEIVAKVLCALDAVGNKPDFGDPGTIQVVQHRCVRSYRIDVREHADEPLDGVCADSRDTTSSDRFAAAKSWCHLEQLLIECPVEAELNLEWGVTHCLRN
jgi:hypothetical protein